jgi:hypothetical protein
MVTLGTPGIHLATQDQINVQPKATIANNSGPWSSEPVAAEQPSLAVQPVSRMLSGKITF